MQSQVAECNRPLYPKVAHNWLKVASNYGSPFCQVHSKVSVLMSDPTVFCRGGLDAGFLQHPRKWLQSCLLEQPDRPTVVASMMTHILVPYSQCSCSIRYLKYTWK